MSEIAEELARRANPERLRAMAKEEAVKKSRELRDRAVSRGKDLGDRALSSPLAVGAVGAVVGSLAGSMIAKRYERSGMHSRSGSERWGYGSYSYGSTEPEAREYGRGFAEGSYEDGAGITAGEGGSSRSQQMKERAGEIKERAVEKTHELRDLISSRGHDLGERASHLRERFPSGEELKSRGSEVLHRVEHNPAALLFGGIALGAVVALVLPITQAERRRVEPVKERARETIRNAAEQIEERAFGGSQESEDPGSYSNVDRPVEDQPPTVH